MAILPSGLETFDYGVQGWSAIMKDDLELLDTRLQHIMTAAQIAGTQTLADNAGSAADPAATTAEILTDSTGGTVSNTISAIAGSGADAAINNALASLVDEINKLRADNVELRTRLIAAIDYSDTLKVTLNTLLARARKTTGAGLLSG